MYLIIGFAIVLGLVLVGILIPKDTYEIWPRRRRLENLSMATEMSLRLRIKRRTVINDEFTIPAQARPLFSRPIGERSCFGSLGLV